MNVTSPLRHHHHRKMTPRTFHVALQPPNAAATPEKMKGFPDVVPYP